MVRFGLCCQFVAEPVKFRHITAKSLNGLPRKQQLARLSEICLHNANALFEAVKTVKRLGIGGFRVLSQLLPLYTHPECGYTLGELPDAAAITDIFSKIKYFVAENDLRLSFHPDQFVILASPHEHVVKNSIQELSYQCMVSELIGAENVNIHLGGVYGDKQAAIDRFATAFTELPEAVKCRLTLENDDISYTVEDLYPLCRKLGIPLVYDVHHHRCNPDGLSEDEATAICVEHWQALRREPHFHISSPKNGWSADNPRPHADYIDINDYPECWRKLEIDFTLDVEAKAKELAIKKLMDELRGG